MPIKLVYIIAPLPTLPASDFFTYWLQTHGPLVTKHSTTLRAKRYVQSHLIDSPINAQLSSVRGMLPVAPFAGITEVWWDSLEDFLAAYSTPEGKAAGKELAEDEAKFIDFSRSCVFITEEHPIFDLRDELGQQGKELLKAVYLVRKKAGWSVKNTHATWLKDHPLVVRPQAEVLGMARYVQSHTLEVEGVDQDVKARGFEEKLDGITEVWVKEGALEMAEAVARGEVKQEDMEKAGEATRKLVEDEDRFVDLGKSRLFVTREYVIFDYTT